MNIDICENGRFCACVCGMYESAFSPFSHYVEERGRRGGGGVSGNYRNKKMGLRRWSTVTTAAAATKTATRTATTTPTMMTITNNQ